MNRDFAEMLKALAAENVDYLVVGAYAVAGHGIPRARRQAVPRTLQTLPVLSRLPEGLG